MKFPALSFPAIRLPTLRLPTLRLPAIRLPAPPKLPAALRPGFTRAEWIFSIKAFAAAMLAVLLASWAGQPRPFWALMTAYIVAHPMAGAVRSKGLFRVLGTLVGGMAAVLLVPSLANAPELLSLALACGWRVAWCCRCATARRAPTPSCWRATPWR